MVEQICQNCGAFFTGRANQLYCTQSCKSAINNCRIAERDKTARLIEKKIKINRRILMTLHRLYGEIELPDFIITKTAFNGSFNNGISKDKTKFIFLDYCFPTNF